MSLDYKSNEYFLSDSSQKVNDCRDSENFDDQQKSKIDINEIIINCFKNISVAYKSGNTIRLYNQLSYLNNITTDHYFNPIPEFFNPNSNSIPEILMKISFDISNRFSLKCKLVALSIIDNLTFEELYGFRNFFYELDIINLSCINLFSEDLNLVLHHLRILLNYCESQKDFADKILLCCHLDRFVMFILNIKDDDQKLVMRIEDSMLSLMCELSFLSSDQFTTCFYASVDCLLQHVSLFEQKINRFEKYIFWIAINCIKSDDKYIDQFYNNTNLMNLIVDVINNKNDDYTYFKSALILLDNLYQKNYFIIPELNLTTIMQAIPVFYSDDILLISLLRILRVHINQPQFFSLVLDSSFISMLSEMFFQSNYSVKIEIIQIFCIIIQYSAPLFLSELINEHVIQMIYEIYISDVDYLNNVLLISLVKLFDLFNNWSNETQQLFLSDVGEIDFSFFDVNEETMGEDQIELITQLKESYENFGNQ